MEVFRTAVALIVRSMVLSAQSAGQRRLLFLQRAIAGGEMAGELARLRDENGRLTSELRMLKDRLCMSRGDGTAGGWALAPQLPRRGRTTSACRASVHPLRRPAQRPEGTAFGAPSICVSATTKRELRSYARESGIGSDLLDLARHALRSDGEPTPSAR